MNNITELKAYRKRRNRVYLLGFLSSVFFFIGILFLIATIYISELLMLDERVIIISGALLSIISIGLFLYTYLSLRPLYISYRGESEYDDIEINSIYNRHLKKNIIDKYGKGYDDWSKENSKEKPLLFEDDLGIFKRKFIDQSIHDLEYANLFDELYKLENKLRLQIDRLISNSNLNLIIGIITSSIAIGYLGLSILNHEIKSTTDLVSYFIPRISTVIFVEIFSFFFLKLYKSNLTEIKYFQNEITNLNFKITALKTAIKQKDNTTISELVKLYANTERNFILKKDESTEKIEIQKMENSSNNELTKNLLELLKISKEK